MTDHGIEAPDLYTAGAVYRCTKISELFELAIEDAEKFSANPKNKLDMTIWAGTRYYHSDPDLGWKCCACLAGSVFIMRCGLFSDMTDDMFNEIEEQYFEYREAHPEMDLPEKRFQWEDVLDHIRSGILPAAEAGLGEVCEYRFIQGYAIVDMTIDKYSEIEREFAKRYEYIGREMQLGRFGLAKQALAFLKEKGL